VKGKSDRLDAESAARAVLSGQANALPKSGTSAVEMIRQIKGARDTAVKGRPQAMQPMNAIIVSAPAARREQLEACQPTPRECRRFSHTGNTPDVPECD
jgi:transposase